MISGPGGYGIGKPQERGRPVSLAWGRWVTDSLNVILRKANEPKTPFFRGGGGHKCIPWKPTISGGNVKFAIGTLNQMVASNWDEEFALDPEETLWPTLNVTASNGALTGYEIALAASTPSSDQIEVDTPPSSFKIVLGVIVSGTATMAVCENLEAVGVEQFRESRDPSTTGEEPFKRWWRWKVTQNYSGDYPYIT